MAKEVRHVSSDTPAWGFWGGTFARPGEEDKGRSAGPTATGAGGDLRRCDPHRGGEDRWRWSPDHPGLGYCGLMRGARTDCWTPSRQVSPPSSMMASAK